MSWNVRTKDGTAYSGLTDAELEEFGDEIDHSSVVEVLPKTDRTQSAKALRAQAATQYAADVEAQKQQNVAEMKTERPVVSALFPRTAESTARGDRSETGRVFDAARDISGMPGRAVRAVVGGIAGGLGAGSAREGLRYAADDFARTGEDPNAGFAENLASGIVTDPYALPLAAVGGPLLGKALGSARPLVRRAAAWGADPAINAVIGATERGMSTDPSKHWYDPMSMAIDVGTGGIAAGLGAGVRKIPEAIAAMRERGVTSLGDAIIASTPLRKRGELVDRWASTTVDPVTGVEIPLAARRADAAQAIGNYMTTDATGTPVPSSLFREEANKAAYASNRATKMAEANRNLESTYDDLEKAYDYEIGGLGKRGSKLGYVPEAGVNIAGHVAEVEHEMMRDAARAYDMDAIKNEGNRILTRLERGKRLTEGTVGPRAARDLRNRIHNEIKDTPASRDLDEFHERLYGKINDDLTTQLSVPPGVAPDPALYGPQDVADLQSGAEASNKFRTANRAISKGLSIEPGLERSRLWNPNNIHSPFGETMEDIKMGTMLTHPLIAAARVSRLPTTQIAASEILSPVASALRSGAGTARASGTIASGLLTSKRASGRSEKARLEQDLATLQSMGRSSLTQSEYDALNSILRKGIGDRSAEEIAYARKYGLLN